MKYITTKKISGKIVVKTGLHIGGTNAALNIGGPDKFVVRNPINNIPYIPGSSLKGKLRSLIEIKNGCSKVSTDPNSESGKLFGVAGGNDNTASGESSSIAGGICNSTYNTSEFAAGEYNKSTESAYAYLATRFSIGNGKFDEGITNIRHNAFEVKQNGDIYIPDTSTGVADYKAPMIHLQQKIIDLETTITNLEARIAALENK